MVSRMPYDRRSVFAWFLYDFANSAYSALVLTFIYAVYFTKEVAVNEIEGSALWSTGILISSLTVAALSPVLGALADRGGLRMRILFSFTLICVIATASLHFVLPGEVVKGLTIFVVANICMEIAMVFYNAVLPDIASQSQIGRISGYGWSFGYVGGLLAMLIAMTGFVGETPWFGLSTTNGENIRATNLLVASWFGLLSLPLFLAIKDKKSPVRIERAQLFVGAFRELRSTFTALKKHRQIMRLLIARIFYNDGVVTIYSLGGVYAGATFQFDFDELLLLGVVLNITAGIGAFVMGFLDDRIGGRNTIQITNIGFVLASTVAVLAPDKTIFWLAAVMVGLFIGPNQAASRSLMGRFVPKDKESEFFGFYAFSGKATSFLGPLGFAVLTTLFESQRAGISVVIPMFLMGGLILQTVNEEEGKRLSGRS